MSTATLKAPAPIGVAVSAPTVAVPPRRTAPDASKAVPPAPPTDEWGLAPPALFRWTVAQYHQLIAAGILGPEHKVELLEGWIVTMAPLGRPHFTSATLTERRLQAAIPVGWDTRFQGPITLSESEPEPDVVIARGAVRSYVDHHPAPAEIELVVEVADSSLAYDRSVKARIYAAAGISVYWIVNLVDRQVEVFTDPSTGSASSPATYRALTTIPENGKVQLTLDSVVVAEINVADLLP